jgi:hypothetical protein
MPYALCPMPYALCPVVPHLSEKGYSFCLWAVNAVSSTSYLKKVNIPDRSREVCRQ